MDIRKLLLPVIPKPILHMYRSFRCQRKKTLSQFGQDFWVFGEAFNGKQNGYFLEVGAAEGTVLSNTFLLEKKFGWRGICIEANPLLFQELADIRKSTCLNVCIDNQEGTVDYLLDGFLSGIIDASMDNRLENVEKEDARVIKVKTRDLFSILEEQKAPQVIDYFSIDVEGAETRILSEFPFDKYRFNCITMERPTKELRNILKQKGYVLIKEIPDLDAFYIHESFRTHYYQNMIAFWKGFA